MCLQDLTPFWIHNVASELTTVTYKRGTTTLGTLLYTYDAAGNRIKAGGTFGRSNIPPALASASYNANNQQTAFGATTETYDLNGNMATITDVGGTTTYTWNARNQLTAISGPGLTGSFTYDSFGRRTGKTINATTTNFVYDGLNPVQEKAGASVTANLLTGLGIDEFFTRTDGVGVRSLLPDALGSTVALGDNTGTLQTQYTYEPFGMTTQTGAASTNSYKYTGREDDGTGLLYYRARYYQPRLQRFISEDPIGFRGRDVNLYGYVQNNPTSLIDPYGLEAFGSRELAEPWRNTIICDGSGGIVVQVPLDISPNRLRCGVRDCKAEHENYHLGQALKRSPNICLGQRRGAVVPALEQAERVKEEINAHGIEINCLLKKLKNSSCDCKDTLEQEIGEVSDEREKYRRKLSGPLPR